MRQKQKAIFYRAEEMKQVLSFWLMDSITSVHQAGWLMKLSVSAFNGLFKSYMVRWVE